MCGKGECARTACLRPLVVVPVVVGAGAKVEVVVVHVAESVGSVAACVAATVVVYVPVVVCVEVTVVVCVVMMVHVPRDLHQHVPHCCCCCCCRCLLPGLLLAPRVTEIAVRALTPPAASRRGGPALIPPHVHVPAAPVLSREI